MVWCAFYWSTLAFGELHRLTLRMASGFDMLDLLTILAKCDEFESSSSCSTCAALQHLPTSSHEVKSSEVKTLFCQCDNEDAIV